MLFSTLVVETNLNVENFLSLDTKSSSITKTKINLLLYNCTLHEFRLTENKPIYLVLANVGSKKNFFSLEVTIAACLKSLSHFNGDFHQKRKKRYIVLFLFLFLSEGRQVLKLPH